MLFHCEHAFAAEVHQTALYNEYLYISVVLIIFFTTTTDSVISLNVSFSESNYNVKEGDELVVVKLVLTDVSSTDINVWILSENNTATGK